MKYLERYLKSTFNLFAKSALLRYRDKTIEQVLKNSIAILDEQTIGEIKFRTKELLLAEGGFTDRGGRGDLYYSLFGMFVSECLSEIQNLEKLSGYIKKYLESNKPDGVYLYCAAVLCSKLPGCDAQVASLASEIQAAFRKIDQSKPDYNLFLTLLTLYYLKDIYLLLKVLKKTKFDDYTHEVPCSVLAAHAVVNKISGKKVDEVERRLMAFYRGDGSFSAIKNSPTGDLLSTAVALFALNFSGADLRLIKPDCLRFVNELYENGGFKATKFDDESDIEYTFYGLLALGSLSS